MNRWMVLILFLSACKTSKKVDFRESSPEQTTDIADFAPLGEIVPEKADGRLLKTMALKIETFKIKENEWPIVKVAADPKADHVEYSFCRENAECRKGISSLESIFMPGLDAGVYRIRVRSCVNAVQLETSSGETCGPYQEAYFDQKENPNIELNRLLAEKVDSEKEVTRLGKIVFDSASRILDAFPKCNDSKIKAKIPEKQLRGLLQLGPQLIGLSLLEQDARLEISDSPAATDVTVVVKEPSGEKKKQESGFSDFIKLTVLGTASILAPKLLIKFGKTMKNVIGPYSAKVRQLAPWKFNLLIGAGSIAIVGLLGYAVYEKKIDPAKATETFFESVFSLAGSTTCQDIETSYQKIAQAFVDAKTLREKIDQINKKIAKVSNF